MDEWSKERTKLVQISLSYMYTKNGQWVSLARILNVLKHWGMDLRRKAGFALSYLYKKGYIDKKYNKNAHPSYKLEVK